MSSIGGTYGLSGSGIDVDSIVKSLMTGQQAKADALLQKKTVLEWQKTAYNTIYDDISKFRDEMFNYKLQGTLSPNKVSSSNTSVATVTANAGAADVNHTLVVTQVASGKNLTSSVLASSTLGKLASQVYNNVGVPVGSFNVTIGNGAISKSISIDPTNDTINDVVSRINNAGVNMKATYDSTLNRFFLSTTNTGLAATISITDTDGGVTSGTEFFRDKLGLPLVSTGQNANITLDGVDLTQASNTFTISDVTYNLTGVSPIGPPPTPTTISVTNDTDTAVASMQSLVDSYNKILTELNGKMNETRYKDFPPLTDAQKSVMKETDITAWETKAKSGMLHNDQTLANLVNTMRNAFSNPVSTGTYNSGSSIGITTGSYTEGGKLYLNTDKLRTALNANPDVLNQLFGASGERLDGSINANSQGIAGRLYDGIKTKMDQVAQIAGTTGGAQYDTKSNFSKKISAYNLQISHQADRFDVVQKAYYKKFNAMEVALKKLSSQSSWLQSFGSTGQ